LHRVRGLTIGYSCYDLFAITNASISNVSSLRAALGPPIRRRTHRADHQRPIHESSARPGPARPSCTAAAIRDGRSIIAPVGAVCLLSCSDMSGTQISRRRRNSPYRRRADDTRRHTVIGAPVAVAHHHRRRLRLSAVVATGDDDDEQTELRSARDTSSGVERRRPNGARSQVGGAQTKAAAVAGAAARRTSLSRPENDSSLSLRRQSISGERLGRAGRQAAGGLAPSIGGRDRERRVCKQVEPRIRLSNSTRDSSIRLVGTFWVALWRVLLSSVTKERHRKLEARTQTRPPPSYSCAHTSASA
jgi:hypothetical protein